DAPCRGTTCAKSLRFRDSLRCARSGTVLAPWSIRRLGEEPMSATGTARQRVGVAGGRAAQAARIAAAKEVEVAAPRTKLRAVPQPPAGKGAKKEKALRKPARS